MAVVKNNIEIEGRLRCIEDEIEGIRLVLVWLLDKMPDDRGMNFLATQAIEFEGHQRFQAQVEFLDGLREELVALRGSADTSQSPGR